MIISLKTKFLIPTLILLALGLGVIGYTSSLSARETLQTLQERDAAELTRLLTSNVSKWIESIKRDAELWSTRQEFINFEADASRATLKRLHAANPLYAGISTMGTNGVVVYATTATNEGKLDLSDRDYIQKALSGEVGVSDINISKVTGLPVVAVAAPLKKDGKIVGAIYMTVNIPALTDHFFTGVNTGQHGYIMMFNRLGGFLSHPRMQELNQSDSKPEYLANMLSAGSGIEFFQNEDGTEYMAAFDTDTELGWVVAACYQVEELYATIKESEKANFITGLIVLGIAAALIYILVRSITTPLKNTVRIINDLAQGEGDLTIRLKSKSRDEIGQLTTALNQFIGKLWQLIRQIKDNSVQISQHVQEMNQNNAEINKRTQQQATGIASTSTSLEEITGSVQTSAANADQANQNADQTFELAKNGGEVLNKTMASMREVTDASNKINDIIKVVNEIAFQTNLLALNASVEAARAGDAGQAFAVVAGEVRSLATRSAQAAQEIQELITDSVAKIQGSNDLVMQSDQILKSIITAMRQANETIAGISHASREQSKGIGAISETMRHMDEAVQQNSAMVSENFNLSNELSETTKELVDLVSRFRL